MHHEFLVALFHALDVLLHALGVELEQEGFEGGQVQGGVALWSAFDFFVEEQAEEFAIDAALEAIEALVLMHEFVELVDFVLFLLDIPFED